MTLKRLVVLTDAEINALRFALHNTYMSVTSATESSGGSATATVATGATVPAPERPPVATVAGVAVATLASPPFLIKEEDAPGWRPARSAARSAEIKLREAAPTLTAAESAVLSDLTARGEIQWEVGGPPHHSNWNTWKRCCEKLKQIDR